MSFIDINKKQSIMKFIAEIQQDSYVSSLFKLGLTKDEVRLSLKALFKPYFQSPKNIEKGRKKTVKK